jgi:hypothetical protein
MVHSTDGDFSQPPTELIARLLLESARQDPALLGRSHPPKSAPMRLDEPDPLIAFPMLAETPRSLPLMAAAPPEFSHQFEDLVSLALASARHAEDASDEARSASSSARRSMRAMAVLGLIGILLGVAAIADNHLFGLAATMTTTAVAGPAAAPDDAVPAVRDPAPSLPPREAQMRPPAAPTADPTANPVASDIVVPAAAEATRPTVPVYHAPPAAYSVYSAPWPNDRQPRYHYRNTTTRRAYVPPFFVALRRDISSLLRGFPPHS